MARGIPVQPEGKTATPVARTPKVVQIPVHFVGLESVSASKIQKVFRGFLVRKSVKKIMGIKKEVDEIEARIGRSEEVELIKKDAKEKVKVNEMLMSLLFKLDSIRGVDSGVRDFRRAVIKKAIALQERVDAIASSPSSAIDLSENETDQCLQDVMISEGSGTQNCDNEDVGGDSEVNAADVENQDVGGVEACAEKVMLENAEKQKAKDVGKQEAGGVEACVEKLILENVEKQKAAAGTQVDSLMEDNGEEMREKTPAFSECVEESVETSLMEEGGIEENDVQKMGGEGRKVGGEDSYRNRVLLEKMVEENEKMTKLMTQLCERNEAQTRMLNTLTHRVEQLEKAFICDKIKRKKKRNSA